MDLLGRFIGVLHAVARLHGKKLDDIAGRARTPREQRDAFDSTIAPLFEYRVDQAAFEIARFALCAGHSAGAV